MKDEISYIYIFFLGFPNFFWSGEGQKKLYTHKKGPKKCPLKGSSGETHLIFVTKAHIIYRLLVCLLSFLDYPLTQDRLPSVLE